MTNVAITTEKKVSKTTLAIRFYRHRANVTKDLLEAGTDEAKVQIRAANKMCKEHFVKELGLTEKGANTYLSICRDMVLGKDPHAGRKSANKARSLRLAAETVQPTAQETVEPAAPQADLTQRWGVGETKGEPVLTFSSRAQAQQYAKENNMKWFDTKVA